MVDPVDDVAARCLGLRIRMLDRVLTGVYDRHLRPHGLRISQLTLLTAVAKAEEVGPADLSRWLAMEKSTVSRTVDRMIAQGWLEALEAADGRSYRLRLTAAGRETIDAAYPDWRAAQREVERLVGDGGAEALTGVAGRINARWADR